MAENEPKKEKKKEDGYEEMKKFPPFRVWDMPEQVATDLKSFAREYAGNKAWLAIKLLLDKHKQFATFNARITELEQRISAIEEQEEQPAAESGEKEDPDKPEAPLTFRGRLKGEGGKPNGKI